MCPNCSRGLTEKKEVCIQCAGTGIWNPASLTVSEVEIVMNDQKQEAQEAEAVVAAAGAEVTAAPEVGAETPGDAGVVPEAEVATPVAAPEEAAPVEDAAPEAAAPVAEVAPETAE